MPPSVKRRWDEYPTAYLYAARRIAMLSAPTLNEHFDDPPLQGPFATRNAVNTYRAEWHRFREALRQSAKADPTSYPARLYHILEALTTMAVSRLQADSTEEWWLEFAPHPIILSEWRSNPELFARDKISHQLLIKSLDTTNSDT